MLKPDTEAYIPSVVESKWQWMANGAKQFVDAGES